MDQPTTLNQLLQFGSDNNPAITAPGRSALSYSGLRQLVKTTVDKLNGLGVQRGDRVAIVLPNGPEMACAFLSVASGMTSAPLNPAYKFDEFKFYLSDLNAKVLLVERDSDSPAIEAARDLGIPIFNVVVPANAAAGYFEIDADAIASPSQPTTSVNSDTALILHTSGTTSRPKIVPLSQANVCASAENIHQSLQLKPDDGCLNIMPLFHIHGLIAAILSSLAAGASIYCTPGFNALKFFSWHDDFMPSWYTAVPTMHQAILGRASRNQASVAKSRLRLVRSSSASLPPPIMAQMAELWNCPIIEAYGMTEAAHQMASNPLPPAKQKSGSVGIAAGPEVAIMDVSGQILDQGDLGEIAIRGANVTAGYENNDVANREAFINGWFRTGDQGTIDPEGYLRLTGRLKEIINRGGEKISPREVDEVILEHPAVAQVVTFAVAHEKLGENVAAAIVLNEGKTVSEKELRQFASQNLADFKVPRQIVFLDEIPKGATGKLQRIGLAKVLGLED